MEELQNLERDNGKRIIRFRQHAFLLLTQYKQVEIAAKLDIDKTHFNKYYNDPETNPGIEFLNKFDSVFGSDVKSLINYLKTYKKEDFLTAEEPSDAYELSGLASNYIESLKDQIVILKRDAEFNKGQIAFLQNLINKLLQDKTPGKEEGEVSENYNVKIVQPENEARQSKETSSSTE